MNRIRTVSRPARRIRISAPAAVLDARQADAQLARPERRLGAAGVERAGQPHRPRELPERALREVKRGAALLADGRQLAAHDHERVTHERHGHVADGDPRQVHDELDAVGGFDDVEGQRAFRGDVRARPEPVDDPPEILVGRKSIAPFQIDARHAAYSSKRDHGWGGNRL